MLLLAVQGHNSDSYVRVESPALTRPGESLPPRLWKVCRCIRLAFEIPDGLGDPNRSQLH